MPHETPVEGVSLIWALATHVSAHRAPQAVSESSLGAASHPDHNQTLTVGKGVGFYPPPPACPLHPGGTPLGSVNSGPYQVVDAEQGHRGQAFASPWKMETLPPNSQGVPPLSPEMPLKWERMGGKVQTFKDKDMAPEVANKGCRPKLWKMRHGH